MSLDMYDTIDYQNRSDVPGGVVLIVGAQGGYTGPGGVWQAATPNDPVTLNNVVVQSASLKTADMLASALGGVRIPNDLRVVYLNDGTQIYPADDGKEADLLMFSDGITSQEWKVLQSDNRPWHNYCKAIVERYRGTA
jgi:hypothetical protein